MSSEEKQVERQILGQQKKHEKLCSNQSQTLKREQLIALGFQHTNAKWLDKKIK